MHPADSARGLFRADGFGDEYGGGLIGVLMSAGVRKGVGERSHAV